MSIALRPAAAADLPALLVRMRAFNAVEGIAISDGSLEVALRRLLEAPELGIAWLIEDDQVTVGYAIVTYGYDLEFAGRDAYLTELWVDEAQRGRGTAAAALALLTGELAARDIRALHLLVRPDNPAMRLYERAAFERSPRIFMTRLLA